LHAAIATSHSSSVTNRRPDPPAYPACRFDSAALLLVG
jgi:hypothetical protein